MNHIEARALKWIAKTTGYPENQISFSNNSSPDFTTPAGQGFEVKYCPYYPRRRRARAFMIYPRQWTQLQKHPNCSIIVFGEGPEPVDIIPMKDIPFGTRRRGDIRINCCETNNPKAMLREEYLLSVKKNKQATGVGPMA